MSENEVSTMNVIGKIGFPLALQTFLDIISFDNLCKAQSEKGVLRVLESKLSKNEVSAMDKPWKIELPKIFQYSFSKNLVSILCKLRI